MFLSQAGIEGGRDGEVCCIQALAEQGEALEETQGLPSLWPERERREKNSGGTAER